ncbi:DUF6843 domain-containing protein [Fictibacillus phosphorivorans]|uniref:DUF6843 domain-containing protein n=1 Tax=Fictibacillus phosphorivorans TaxID=1221500 RepID=UPI003CF99BC9
MKKIILLILILSGLAGCKTYKEEFTNNIFLLPEGFDGAVFVFYDVPGKGEFKKENEYSIIPVKTRVSEALAGTPMGIYGAAFTSQKEQTGSPTVNDKYYYVDKDGKRTKVPDYCVSHTGGGGFSGEPVGGVTYRVSYVTNTGCGESFYLDGREQYHIQRHEISKEWSEYFGE